jgi:hypothetical protein
MNSKGAKQTRDMFEVFCEAMEGADRVVVETKNALGEMDAHYLHAPELRKAIKLREPELRKALLALILGGCIMTWLAIAGWLAFAVAVTN